MSLPEIISEQLRRGDGYRVGAGILYRAVSRQAAQEAADAASEASLDQKIEAAQAEIDAAQAAILATTAPITEEITPPTVNDIENPTPEEQAAVEAFVAFNQVQDKLVSDYREIIFTHQKNVTESTRKKTGAELSRARLLAFHARLGEVAQAEDDPLSLLIADFDRFIAKKTGQDLASCGEVVTDYLAANPSATLVKVYNFEGSPALIYDSSGALVYRPEGA